MDQRLKQLRKALGLTQQEFADRLGITRGAIANYELGRNSPIDAAVILICKTFDVSEEWLRTGNGEMFVKLSRSEKLAQFAASLQREDEDYFPRQFVDALADLDMEDWAAIKRFMQKLLDKQKTDP